VAGVDYRTAGDSRVFRVVEAECGGYPGLKPLNFSTAWTLA